MSVRYFVRIQTIHHNLSVICQAYACPSRIQPPGCENNSHISAGLAEGHAANNDLLSGIAFIDDDNTIWTDHDNWKLPTQTAVTEAPYFEGRGVQLINHLAKVP